ncbi:MAG: ribose 5-phosphate isomerase B [Deltaproteobacteria bacterium]|nr:ribose 5-phosphate isomerase B [Deltaproteobacteria bacterium]
MSPHKIFLGADHGGFELKQALKRHLEDGGFEVADFGTHGTEAVDYPDFALLVAQAVSGSRAAGGDAVGIMIDSIGQASAIVCNKVPGIRAVAGYDPFAIRSSREHNDANVLCLGGQVLGRGLACDLVDTWLRTAYAGGRHQNRVDKIHAVERRYLRSK